MTTPIDIIPVLVECPATEADGFTYPKDSQPIPVKIVRPSVLDLLQIRERSSRHRKLFLKHREQLAWLKENIDNKPLKTMRTLVFCCEDGMYDRENHALYVAGKFSYLSPPDPRLVLWRRADEGPLVSGLLCSSLAEAVTALLCFWVGERSQQQRFCVMCGKPIRTGRGTPRQTCGDKCRKQKSRMNAEKTSSKSAR